MKNLWKKIIFIILILFIISGIIILGIVGFEKPVTYQAGTRIEVFIPKGYDKQDILSIAQESFSTDQITFEEIEKLNQIAAIKLKDYTQEELKNYKTKIAEKYGIEADALELHEIAIPKTRISTLVMPYGIPVLLVTVLSFIYIALRNRQSENRFKILFKKFGLLVMVLGIYFSCILIFRIPFGSSIMPIALAIYLITLVLLVNNIKK